MGEENPKEYNIDAMKYRKSTHLAGVDVETEISEKGKCIRTIKEAYYQKGVDVSGRKTDGYFLTFKEGGLEMMVNSTNRKTIALLAKNLKKLDNKASRNIGNWKDIVLELYFDATVKMKGDEVGGIRIKSMSPVIKQEISDVNALIVLNSSTTLDELKVNWEKLTAEEKKLTTVLSRKEQLKTKLA